MNQSTVLAHANLAFVKYWGKRDATRNIPLNNSISMNLSAAQTITTVTFDDNLEQDVIYLERELVDDKFAGRVSKHLDRVRELGGVTTFAKVETSNSFPASTGFASSASGFAALSMAATTALGINLSERDLSILARKGSGSACRSIPSGFVEWDAGHSSEDSYAFQLAGPEHWNIVDVAVIVANQAKDVSSSDGHLVATKSPFWPARTQLLPARLETVRRAILEQDFDTFGREIEAEAMSMHAIMMTSAHEVEAAWRSGIYYWSPDTLELLIHVQHWRADGLPVYFTLDAGPTVHLMCPAAAKANIEAAVKSVQGDRLWAVISSKAASGAQMI